MKAKGILSTKRTKRRNEMGMAGWPSPEMKMDEPSAYDSRWVGHMAGLGSGA
jgi:hypothetical protein